MKNHFLSLLFVFCSWIGSPTLWAIDQLSVAGAPYAPLDPAKAKADAGASAEDREEAVKEFKGLMSMAIKKVPEKSWVGRSMADCETPKKGEAWCSRCEVIMPHANGFYSFFPDGNSCTLQGFEVQVHVSEKSVLRMIRASLQNFLGRGSAITPMAGWRAEPEQEPGRHWTEGAEAADLFLDRTSGSRGEPFIHFIWNRSRTGN